MCLKSRVRTPRGPVTVTWRALMTTVTEVVERETMSELGEIEVEERERHGQLFQWSLGRSNLPTFIICQYSPPSGISTERDARMVFMMTTVLYLTQEWLARSEG